MSEEKKPVLPVSGLFDELSAGSELTAVAVLNRLIVSDASLSMITQISDPVGLSVLDVLITYAESKKYKRTAKILKRLLKSYRENMCSYQGWRSKQIIQGLIADLERLKREGEDMGERLVGRSKR